MEHRRVDIDGHLYQWVDSTCWQAIVMGATHLSSPSAKIFYNFEEAMAWVEQRPQFMLIECKCIRAFKLPATGSLTEEGK